MNDFTWSDLTPEARIDAHDGMVTLRFTECVDLVPWGEDEPRSVAIVHAGRVIVVPRTAVALVTGDRP